MEIKTFTLEDIRIISENDDKTTNEVCMWLMGSGFGFQRHNVNDIAEISIRLSSEKIDNKSSSKETGTIVWNRRGKLQLVPQSVRNSGYSGYVNKETFSVLEFLEHQWKKDNLLLGSYLEETLNNKILNLSVAKAVGLTIPETLVTNKKADLLAFYSENNPIISKCIFLEPRSNVESYYYETPGTFVVDKNDIDLLSDNFSPSLFQKYTEKQYEVRVFVTGNEFFAMAIFSQNDEQTKIDFRNYNREKPNRNVPFELPLGIKNKIKSFLKQKQMNQGSIDFIVTPENEFVFLEINPQGQLDWVSKNCNYYIEKHIAEQLINRNINVL